MADDKQNPDELTLPDWTLRLTYQPSDDRVKLMSFLPFLALAAAATVPELTNPIPQVGDANFNPSPSHSLRFTMDNDVFCGHDQDYTNGLRFDYAQRMKSGNYWGLSLVQEMYTPSTNSPYPVMGEHPYAGYLALGFAYITTGDKVGTSTELQLGTTGRASLAEQAQDIIHSIGDIDKWEGWNNQIPAEFTMQLSSRQDWNIKCLDCQRGSGWQQDGMMFTKQEFGTVSIAAEAGFTYRLGTNLPARMRNMGNGSTNFGVSTLNKPDYDAAQSSYFMIASTSLKYVARDLFIDGGVFDDFDTTCTRVPWIAEAQLGFGAVYHSIDYYFGFVYRTDSYKTQDSPTLYGTFSIGWNW